MQGTLVSSYIDFSAVELVQEVQEKGGETIRQGALFEIGSGYGQGGGVRDGWGL